MCARYFFVFVFKYQSLPQKIVPEIRFSKPYSRYSLSIFETLYVFLLNVERDKLVLGRVRLLLS